MQVYIFKEFQNCRLIQDLLFSTDSQIPGLNFLLGGIIFASVFMSLECHLETIIVYVLYTCYFFFLPFPLPSSPHTPLLSFPFFLPFTPFYILLHFSFPFKIMLNSIVSIQLQKNTEIYVWFLLFVVVVICIHIFFPHNQLILSFVLFCFQKKSIYLLKFTFTITFDFWYFAAIESPTSQRYVRP